MCYRGRLDFGGNVASGASSFAGHPPKGGNGRVSVLSFSSLRQVGCAEAKVLPFVDAVLWRSLITIISISIIISIIIISIQYVYEVRLRFRQ